MPFNLISNFCYNNYKENCKILVFFMASAFHSRDTVDGVNNTNFGF